MGGVLVVQIHVIITVVQLLAGLVGLVG